MKLGIHLLGIFLSFNAFGLEGIGNLETLLIDKNQTLESFKNQLKAKESLLESSKSNYYPTLSVVGGWENNEVEDPNDRTKGYLGYIDGRLNLFNGLKDITIYNQKKLEVQIAKIEFELATRELKQQLVRIASEMIYLHKLQNILMEEEKITNGQKQWAAKKVAAGLTSSVDNLEFDLREEEIRIQQRQIDQLHKEAHLKLVEMFGSDIADKELEKTDFTEIKSQGTIVPFKPEESLEVQRSVLLAKLSDLEKKEVRSDFLPSVDFVYSFGRVTPSEQTPINFSEYKYGVHITIPLFSGFQTYYKNRAATSNSIAKNAQATQAKLNSTSLYGSLSEKIKELNDLYKINERKSETAKKYFELTVTEYKRGIKNSPDLVGATERWFSSQKKKYELLNEIELTKVKIESLN